MNKLTVRGYLGLFISGVLLFLFVNLFVSTNTSITAAKVLKNNQVYISDFKNGNLQGWTTVGGKRDVKNGEYNVNAGR